VELNERSVSIKQQRLFGLVRSFQKGDLKNPSSEVTKIASTTSKSDVKKMASTKHEGLPLRKIKEEIIRARLEGPQKGLGAALCPICGQMGCTKDHEAEKEEEVTEGKVSVGPRLGEPRTKGSTAANAGQGEKIQKRTLKWMRDRGQTGAPGLNAMKERQKEHEAKRGVKEEVEQMDEIVGTAGGAIAGGILGGPLGAVAGGLLGSKLDGKKKKPEKAKEVQEELELEEERNARKMNVRTKKTIQATIQKDAEKEAKRKANKTGEYKETPKKKPRLKKPSQLTRVTGASKPPRTQKGAMAYDGPNKERSEAADRVKAKTKAAKKTPITKATTTKPEPKKKTATKPAAMKKAVERKKEVIKQPEKKAPEKKTSRPSFKDFVAKGRKRHRKATQAARVLAKGAAAGVKKAVKVAKDIHSVTQVNKDKTVNMQSYEPELPMVESLTSEKKLGKKVKNRTAKDLIKTGKSLNAQDLKKADEDGDGIVRVIDAGYRSEADMIAEGKVKKVAAMIRSLRGQKKPVPHKFPVGASGGDAGAKAKEIMRKKDHESVNFLHPDD
jgi:hypothetical protein